ncbi:MAG: hypothetical protein RLZZ400_871 [Actinomycetota bacterium]
MIHSIAFRCSRHVPPHPSLAFRRGRRRGKQGCIEEGSAPVGFVLTLAPLFLLVQVLAVVLAKAQLDQAVLSQVVRVARICTLADSDLSVAEDWNQRTMPGWIATNSIVCRRDSFASATLEASVRGFPWIISRMTWHAPLETP